MVGPEVQVGSGNGSDAPLGLTGETVGLVVARGGGDDLVSVLVHSPGCGGCQLGLLLGLLLNLGNLWERLKHKL